MYFRIFLLALSLYPASWAMESYLAPNYESPGAVGNLMTWIATVRGPSSFYHPAIVAMIQKQVK